MTETQIQGFGLSPQQDLVWRTAKDNDGRVAATTAVVELTGPLDSARLGAAVRHVLTQHEILRTRLVLPSGYVAPVQTIADRVDARIEPAGPEAASAPGTPAEALLADEPVRLRLVRLGDDRHLLLVGGSAGVFDRASAALFTAGLAEAYAGPVAASDEESLQYADLAEWLNERMRDGRFERPRFLDGIADGVTVPRLPFELPGAGGADRAVVPVPDLLPAGVEGALHRLGCSLRDLLLAAWTVTLHRYSGADVVLTGVAENGRMLPELSSAIGPLARLLPVAVPIAGDTTFRQVVDVVRGTAAVLESDAELFDPRWWSGRDADAIHPVPAFDLVEPGAPGTAGGVTFALREVHGGHPSAALSLCFLQAGPAGGDGELCFDPGRFPAEDVRALGSVLRTVLAHAVDDLDGGVATMPVADLALSTDPEDAHDPVTVLDQVLRRVAEAPEAVAVEDAGGTLTYRELDRVAAALAARLAERGAGPGGVVPILLPRGTAAVAAMLGAWRAGAAFTVIDQTTPAGRIAAILADTAATVAISNADLAGGLAGAVPAVLVDDPAGTGPAGTDPATTAGPAPDDPAYVVFTSGSTGTPKGVVVSHGALAAYVRGLGGTHPGTRGGSFAIVSTLAADLGYTAVFSALASGGRLSVVPMEVATDAVRMADWFAAHPIDCLKIVPSHLAALLAGADHPERVLPRRLLVLGGEACPADLVERVAALAPDLEVVNHYGPTETTIGVCTFRTGRAPVDPRAKSVPIGTPLPGTRAEVLDPAGRPLPAWIAGELHVAGPQVARGYLNQPALTAERFVTVAGSAQRWYRTGDTVRRLPGGALEYLGRVDDQVKINGYRVEPQEVEAVLRRHRGVRECVVAVVGEPDRALTAYVVGDGSSLSVDALREHARDLLPEYMLPRAVVLVDELPRTANGKIDKAALAAIGAERAAGAVHVPPRDSLEMRVLEIWQALLKKSRLGVTDDFFESGGHSLLSLQLLGEISRQLGHRLPISVLFDSGTVEGMARAIREQDSWQSPTLIPIRAGGSRPPVFCVHAGGGSVLGYLDLVRALDADIPVYGLESVGLDGGQAPLTRVDEMVERYAADIEALDPSGPVSVVGWGLGGIFAFALAQRLRAAGRPVGNLAIVDGAAPDPAALAEVIAGRATDPHYVGMLDDDVVARFAAHYQLPVAEEDLAGRSDEEQRAVLTAAMHQQNVLTEDAGVERLETLFRVYRANIAAVRDYVQNRRLAAAPDYPLLLLRAKHDFNTDERDPLLGWPALFGDRIAVESFAGDHYEVMRSPTVDGLAALVERAHTTD
ncbi:amino acid adenylation domain-containing protein [Actinoplanes oblitus]|uniref:Amino acid adenylation domain-containing protein n=1 Tax=Actinoplanes oblitus TaxID=3040509 RepID=A0ABY8W957_9ACTN|nr:amino acid adenylation domain-containing protein [Actinoplanes oblitus]WIM94399.1 amino acid adenylation domain-containing protein [Actinoplanes oblitus]